MENYQIIATESLGLAQRRLIPTITKLVREMQTNFNAALSTLFNTHIETEIEAQLSPCALDNHKIYSSVNIVSTGTLTLAISPEPLIQLTDRYINETTGLNKKVNNTSLRLLDRLAIQVMQQASLLQTNEKSQIVVTKKLPPQTVILKFSLNMAEQIITFDAILNNDFVQSLTQAYIPQPVINKERIENALLRVDVTGHVTLMSRSLSLGEVSSLNVGDVISMDMSEDAIFSVGGTNLFSGEVSNQNERLHFTVNNKQENN